MIYRQSTIQWSPFSLKHKKYIRDAIKSQTSVAEGAIRSGKTIDHCLIAAIFLETCPDKIHLASGSTAANAKLNIGDCNGFGLEHLFRGRCRWGSYKDNEALYVRTQTGEKIVIFAGGGKADSFKKILGNSYGLWIATEINQHYDSEDSETSFIKVAMGRQAAAKKILRLWDLNPSSPKHKIYRDYIDKWIGEDWYNYQHFTIEDNLSITQERKELIKRQYDVNSVWYRRDILGQRCIAEGLCFPEIANDPEQLFVDDEWMKNHTIVKIEIGVDFGGDKSATGFSATAIVDGYRYVAPLKTVRIKERLDTDRLCEKFGLFVEYLYHKYHRTMYVYCDSAESVLIHTLEKYSKTKGLNVIIDIALKIEINQRIKAINSLNAQGRLKVLMNSGINENADLIDAWSNACWDESKQDKGDVRLDVVSFENPVDICDSFEYSIEGDIDRLIERERR